MKLLAFSDLHRDTAAARRLLKASPGADVLLVVGDLSTQGVGAGDTLDLLSGSAVPVLLVHGNHDAPGEIAALSDRF